MTTGVAMTGKVTGTTGAVVATIGAPTCAISTGSAASIISAEGRAVAAGIGERGASAPKVAIRTGSAARAASGNSGAVWPSPLIRTVSSDIAVRDTAKVAPAAAATEATIDVARPFDKA